MSELKRLIIMRHGEAEVSAPTDRERVLTENGRQQAGQAGKTLASIFGSVDLCMVSPYIRAQETAREVTRSVHARSFSDSELITPEADCRIAVEELFRLFESSGSILLVSHMPFVANLVNYLAGDRDEPVFGFVPAEALAVEFEVFGPGLGSVKRLA